jgi:hypothetical protein
MIYQSNLRKKKLRKQEMTRRKWMNWMYVSQPPQLDLCSIVFTVCLQPSDTNDGENNAGGNTGTDIRFEYKDNNASQDGDEPEDLMDDGQDELEDVVPPPKSKPKRGPGHPRKHPVATDSNGSDDTGVIGRPRRQGPGRPPKRALPSDKLRKKPAAREKSGNGGRSMFDDSYEKINPSI